MADLTTQQKKDYARSLYLNENLTQQEIADKVDMSRKTINRWVTTEKWEELKVGMTLTRDQQIANVHRQVSEMNNAILSRPEGQRFATTAESDTLNKLASFINKLEVDAGISDIISVGRKFVIWLRPFDMEKSKEFLRLWDAFIKDNL